MANETLESELRQLLNRYSADGHANTPDWILAKYMFKTLSLFIQTMDERDQIKVTPKEAPHAGS